MILVPHHYDYGFGIFGIMSPYALPPFPFHFGCAALWGTYMTMSGKGLSRPDKPIPQKDLNMSIKEFIDNEIKSNDVVLFMKGTPQFPQCGFSGQVVQILDHVGVGYKGLNVLESAELRDGIKIYSNWPTIPQLYVKGEFIGGCDIVREMFQAGELQQMFADKGVTAIVPASA